MTLIDPRQHSSVAEGFLDRKPGSPGELWQWVLARTKVRVAREPVCHGHTTPWDYFWKLFDERPPLALVLGPRGGGKSFLSALDTHATSRWSPRHGTRILGGSLAQSEQVYRALRELVSGGDEAVGADEGVIAQLLRNYPRTGGMPVA